MIRTLAILAVGALLGLVIALSLRLAPIPVCPEDAVLIGAGSFEHGAWSRYECGPARDDYQGGAR